MLITSAMLILALLSLPLCSSVDRQCNVCNAAVRLHTPTIQPTRDSAAAAASDNRQRKDTQRRDGNTTQPQRATRTRLEGEIIDCWTVGFTTRCFRSVPLCILQRRNWYGCSLRDQLCQQQRTVAAPTLIPRTIVFVHCPCAFCKGTV
jgi:hypothetical protein